MVEYRGTTEISAAIAGLERELQAAHGTAAVRQIRVFSSKGLCARQLVPYASNAAASFTAHTVGCGIKPSSLVDDAELKDRIQRLWLAWTDEADADGLTMAARTMFEAGECFFRFRPRRPDDGLTVPLQLLSSEHLPLGKCETLPNGHEIVFGIELDRIGRRVTTYTEVDFDLDNASPTPDAVK